MAPVFDRPASHPFEPALSEWFDSRDPELRALAVNLMHDHRVSVDRDRAFTAYVGSPCTGATLKQGLQGYYEVRVRDAATPDFLDAALNASNVHRVHKDLKLVRLLNLSGLHR